MLNIPISINIMKKIITLLVLPLLIASCGKNKQEQMLYDYKAKGN